MTKPVSVQNKALLLLLLSLVSIAIIPLLPKVGQSLSFHHFSDARTVLHVPNFLNVASNFTFLLVGILGLVNTWRQPNAASTRLLYTALFSGICLTAIGSGYYHYRPGNNTLVYDRIPMTIVFMGVLLRNNCTPGKQNRGGIIIGATVNSWCCQCYLLACY